jgi:hypothetical protein
MTLSFFTIKWFNSYFLQDGGLGKDK